MRNWLQSLSGRKPAAPARFVGMDEKIETVSFILSLPDPETPGTNYKYELTKAIKNNPAIIDAHDGIIAEKTVENIARAACAHYAASLSPEALMETKEATSSGELYHKMHSTGAVQKAIDEHLANRSAGLPPR